MICGTIYVQTRGRGGAFLACTFMCTSCTLNISRMHINMHFACKELKGGWCLVVGHAYSKKGDVQSFSHARGRM